MAKGGKLSSALQAQQTRLKKKQKAIEAAQVAQAKAKKTHRPQGLAALQQQASSSKTKGSNPIPITSNGKGKQKATFVQSTLRPIIPFKPTDKILLVGEGDFSFTRSLVFTPPSPDLTHLPPANITATAYDKEEECYGKYTDVQEIVTELREKGVRVIFGVDATKLGKVAALKGKTFDRVVFNFPHAGKGIADQDRNILSNQLLLLGFLQSASHVLARGPIPTAFKARKRKKSEDDDDDNEEEDDDVNMSGDEDSVNVTTNAPVARGTVLVTLRNVVPYTQWDLPRLAKSPPAPQTPSTSPYPRYVLLRSFKFHRNIWKGYIHRMTKGERAGGTGKTGEGGEDRTWEFYLA